MREYFKLRPPIVCQRLSVFQYKAKMSKAKSLEVLARLFQLMESDGGESRQQRLDELIADYDDSALFDGPRIAHDKSWQFCVPTSFRAALDLRQTSRVTNGDRSLVWTQGPWFNFGAGDTIYDSVMAYKPWNPSNIGICLKVERASPVSARTETTPWSPGNVIFDILTPDENHSKLISRRKKPLTQFEFVRLLIEGPPTEWDEFLKSRSAGV